MGALSERAGKERLQAAYDARAAQRDAMADAPWKQLERERFLERMRSIGAGTLLEVGAGHGVSGRFFADQGIDVVCVDLSPELVGRCHAMGLTAHVMDFTSLDFPAGAFDAVFAMNCLLHVPRTELKAALESIRSVLPDGGLFYWGQYGSEEPFEGTFDDDDYSPKRFFSLLTADEIRTAAADVFGEVEYRFIPLYGDRRCYHGLACAAGYMSS